jgi:UDP-MurNAc hydroxylase
MQIEWVNHASFLVQEGNVGLLCDPWIEGFVFDNSWALISPTKFRYDDFARVTHIWISHEHPDHFSPPNLKHIPLQIRNRITVLFQETKDKRVIKFCRGLGFKEAVELPAARWTELGSEFSVFCQPAGRGDSWLAIRTSGHTILNLNDCIYQTEQELAPVQKQLGSVDTLITQFSYASWWGNADEPEKWVKAAKDSLAKIDREIQIFKPKQTILSASFVYFCHEENVYMNAHINRVEDAYEYLKGNRISTILVLYPGDVWGPGTTRDSEVALERYRSDYRSSLEDPVKVTTSSVPLDDLVRAAGSFMRTLRRNNSRFLLGRLPSARIGLDDLGITLKMGLNGIRRVAERPSQSCDICLSSKALLYCLRFAWGGETLLINGRFRVPKGGTYYNFSHWFSIAQANSRWTYYNREYYLTRAMKRLRAVVTRKG